MKKKKQKKNRFVERTQPNYKVDFSKALIWNRNLTVILSKKDVQTRSIQQPWIQLAILNLPYLLQRKSLIKTVNLLTVLGWDV